MVTCVVTPDGCPVAIYAAMPAEPDLSMIRSFIVGRRRVLDLGAGAGRIANPLAASGLDVVAVDESADMLARVVHASTVQARVEEFVADERFDAVLLLSHLFNTPYPATRRAILTTVARHLAPGGIGVIQRHDPAYRPREGGAVLGSVGIALIDVDDSEWPTVRATTRYQVGEQSWDQSWEAIVLDDGDTTDALRQSGLEPILIDGPWVLAQARCSRR